MSHYDISVRNTYTDTPEQELDETVSKNQQEFPVWLPADVRSPYFPRDSCIARTSACEPETG